MYDIHLKVAATTYCKPSSMEAFILSSIEKICRVVQSVPVTENLLFFF